MTDIKERLKATWQRLGNLWYMKYVVVTVLGILLISVGGENSLKAHREYLKQIDELQEEKNRLTEQFQRDQQQLRLLQTDPKTVERVARERYFMRQDNEDIFVLEDEL